MRISNTTGDNVVLAIRDHSAVPRGRRKSPGPVLRKADAPVAGTRQNDGAERRSRRNGGARNAESISSLFSARGIERKDDAA